MFSTQASIGSNTIKRHLGSKQAQQERTIPMKISLRERFRNWLMREDDCEVHFHDEVDRDDHQLEGSQDDAIHFSVLPANGGKIVQVRYYDKSKDRHFTKLHVITPDEKLEEALAHIFQLEVLSR